MVLAFAVKTLLLVVTVILATAAVIVSAGLALIWVIPCLVVMAMAPGRGRLKRDYFLLSFWFSPLIGLVVLLIKGPTQAILDSHARMSGQARSCPACLATIPLQATACRFCGRDVVALPLTVS